MASGVVDYTPIELGELSSAIKNGFIQIDTVLLMISTPAEDGTFSLGTSVDIIKSVIEHADLVIVQVNKNVPFPCGNPKIRISDIDYFVYGDTPLIAVEPPKLDPVSLTNNGMVGVTEEIRDYCNNLLLLGGGEYDKESAPNAWSRIWATANRIDTVPDYLSVIGGSFIGSKELNQINLIDMNYTVTGKKKERTTTLKYINLCVDKREQYNFVDNSIYTTELNNLN